MFNQTPNGIDRVDFAFANYCLARDKTSFGCLMSFLGPRLFSRIASRDAVEGIANHWGETDDPDNDVAYRQAVERLLDGNKNSAAKSEPIVRRRSGQVLGTWRWLRQHEFPLGASLIENVPRGAVYLNTSQFPLWIPSYFNWLKQRPDVKAVFFIHDLLPIERPEFFRPAEYARHKKRLANLARFGAAAMTSSETVRASLARYMAQIGRPDLPILAMPLPISPVFHQKMNIDERLRDTRYFICCGTIEPRKNHLLLLHVWRKLIELYGPAAPKLVLIGNRGWENENVIDLLERSTALRGHVIEVSGLSTPALKRLLDGARALLMPSFAEGYGLPLAEAMAAGVPVIASDIPVFREIGEEQIIQLSPLAGERWLETIADLAQMPNGGEQEKGGQKKPKAKSCEDSAMRSETYFARIDEFLTNIDPRAARSKDGV
jgi:glycosyltransferase involved in cell wall biosynthesis